MNRPLQPPLADMEFRACESENAQAAGSFRQLSETPPRSLFEILQRQAAAQPERIVFRFLGRSLEQQTALTYAELLERSTSLAQALVADGLTGTRIVLGHETGPDFAIAFFAVMAAGCTAVPIATRLLTRPSAALDSLLVTAQPAAIMLDADPPSKRSFSHLPHVWSGPGTHADRQELAEVDTETIAVMQFTSGSTSQPRGVCISHGNFIANGAAISRIHGLAAADTAVSWLPLFHDMGLMLGIVWPMVTGAASVLMRPSAFVSRPAYWLETINHFGASVSSSPNFGYQACLDRVSDAEIAGFDLSRWRTAICGAEPVRPDTVDRFIERFARYKMPSNALVPAFGLAEATVFVSGGPTGDRPKILLLDDARFQKEGVASRVDQARPPSDGGVRRVVSCGRVADNIEVAIVEHGVELAGGKIGEIWVAGPSVARGYFNADEATHDTFHAKLPDRPGLFMRTGDLGFLLDGELYVAGRIKELIIVRGEKHHPHDIEATIRDADPALAAADCAVFTAGPQGAEIVVAAELGRDHCDMAALADKLRHAVSSAHSLHLDAVCFVGKLRLPRTTSGKIRRREAARLWQDGALKSLATFAVEENEAVPYLGPASTLQQICEIWRTMLGAKHVEPDGNFFEMGGDSIRLAQALARLREISNLPLGLSDLFEHPSPRALATFIESGGASRGVADAQARGRRRREQLGEAAAEGIAIVGMAARFPGAPDVARFWSNLASGTISISRQDCGDTSSGMHEGQMVSAVAVLDSADLFDADFFGIGGMEAAAMDPQQRILLECAHEALESAGCDPERAGLVGVFVGSGMNPQRLSLLSPELGDADVAGRWLTILGNDKDYLASRVAYKLGLRGPSLTIQTACSTSLVAVHVACQSLLAGECDVALAGGATVANSLDPKGYRAELGDVRSPDGRCRPFDAEAGGTVFGDGAGVVTLRRLSDALTDGDHIHAVILGSATNNDGAERVGYSAPGIAGQAAVVAEAIAAAGITADAVGYVEAHGTGTPLGDPVEVTALSRAFRGSTDKSGFCALGSVKANIGHASAAAGIAGLIKAILALENGVIPPNPEFRDANAAIDFAGSPFVMEAGGRPWPRGTTPRVAGVSSFGMGGVNAHVIVAEAPDRGPVAGGGESREEILFLSAKTAVALEDMTDQFASTFASGEDKVAEAARTFASGRRPRTHRLAVVADSLSSAAHALADHDPRRTRSGTATHAARPVVFTIPGSGSQRLGMGASLYRREPVYRAAFDRCAAFFTPILGLDLRDLMFADSSADDERAATLARASIAHAAQFAVSVSLAAQWAHWGIKPAAMIGHSFGEIVAAHLAGVFAFEDAARLVAERGRLVELTETGAMLAVLAPREAFAPLLGPEVTIACHNGPAAYTIAGRPDAIAALDATLTARGVLCRALRTERAFHSPLMRDIVEPYVAFVGTLERQAPKIPFVSTVTGRWITRTQAIDPAHWGRQLVEPVLFAEGLATLAASEAGVFLEVGPGRALSTFVEQNLGDREILSAASLAQPDGSTREITGLLCTVGALWSHGCPVVTEAFSRPGARKAALPTHPMRRKAYALPTDRHRTGEAQPLSARAVSGAAMARDLPRPEVAATFIEPGSDLEKTVTQAWRDSLGLKTVGLDDDFFELGGHSLIAAGAAHRLAARLDRPVVIADIFRFPTPRRMAVHLAGQPDAVPRISASA